MTWATWRRGTVIIASVAVPDWKAMELPNQKTAGSRARPLAQTFRSRGRKPFGLGLSGALSGALVAACLVNAGVHFSMPRVLLLHWQLWDGWAALSGWTSNGHLPPGREQWREKIRDYELLSTAGTLIANSSAVVTAWKFLSNVIRHEVGFALFERDLQRGKWYCDNFPVQRKKAADRNHRRRYLQDVTLRSVSYSRTC
jgi:hypothetical protein